MIRTLPLFAALAMAACVPVTEPEPKDACGASGSQSLVGQSADIIAAMTFPIGTRVIYPDTPVTMDLNPERLNIIIGRTGRIEEVSCG
ncbi:I78 family peptidase inhibitor [Tabrizicola sp.]|uniref:I78 family peptidase inhibitor n=1 Tax=Tabrizicola sp. TaxID=2005166 RepID=UPI00286B95F4|nr:I78 family peptidase inhibitor [Tabrizicola sp.]